ncbi:hypothetical protein SK128_014892 [Halocaridina rubra]|uniref:SprT-like domain-containing protein n=1 Tax=Halocaridina rubra TaxID=373956 RepID=A0AAN9A5Y1_HALRR
MTMESSGSMNSTRLSMEIAHLPLTPFGMNYRGTNRKKQHIISPTGNKLSLKTLKSPKRNIVKELDIGNKENEFSCGSLSPAPPRNPYCGFGREKRLSCVSRVSQINLATVYEDDDDDRSTIDLHLFNRVQKSNSQNDSEGIPFTGESSESTSRRKDSILTDVDDGSFVEFYYGKEQTNAVQNKRRQGVNNPESYYTCDSQNNTVFSTSTKTKNATVGFHKYVEKMKCERNLHHILEEHHTNPVIPASSLKKNFLLDESIITGSAELLRRRQRIHETPAGNALNSTMKHPSNSISNLCHPLPDVSSLTIQTHIDSSEFSPDNSPNTASSAARKVSGTIIIYESSEDEEHVERENQEIKEREAPSVIIQPNNIVLSENIQCRRRPRLKRKAIQITVPTVAESLISEDISVIESEIGKQCVPRDIHNLLDRNRESSDPVGNIPSPSDRTKGNSLSPSIRTMGNSQLSSVRTKGNCPSSSVRTKRNSPSSNVRTNENNLSPNFRTKGNSPSFSVRTKGHNPSPCIRMKGNSPSPNVRTKHSNEDGIVMKEAAKASPHPDAPIQYPPKELKSPEVATWIMTSPFKEGSYDSSFLQRRDTLDTSETPSQPRFRVVKETVSKPPTQHSPEKHLFFNRNTPGSPNVVDWIISSPLEDASLDSSFLKQQDSSSISETPSQPKSRQTKSVISSNSCERSPYIWPTDRIRTASNSSALMKKQSNNEHITRGNGSSDCGSFEEVIKRPKSRLTNVHRIISDSDVYSDSTSEYDPTPPRDTQHAMGKTHTPTHKKANEISSENSESLHLKLSEGPSKSGNTVCTVGKDAVSPTFAERLIKTDIPSTDSEDTRIRRRVNIIRRLRISDSDDANSDIGELNTSLPDIDIPTPYLHECIEGINTKGKQHKPVQGAHEKSDHFVAASLDNSDSIVERHIPVMRSNNINQFQRVRKSPEIAEETYFNRETECLSPKANDCKTVESSSSSDDDGSESSFEVYLKSVKKQIEESKKKKPLLLSNDDDFINDDHSTDDDDVSFYLPSLARKTRTVVNPRKNVTNRLCGSISEDLLTRVKKYNNVNVNEEANEWSNNIVNSPSSSAKNAGVKKLTNTNKLHKYLTSDESNSSSDSLDIKLPISRVRKKITISNTWRKSVIVDLSSDTDSEVFPEKTPVKITKPPISLVTPQNKIPPKSYITTQNKNTPKSFITPQHKYPSQSHITPQNKRPPQIKAKTEGHTKQFPRKMVYNTESSATPTLTFLASLSSNVHMGRCHPDAVLYVKNFKKSKELLCEKLYTYYNEHVFSDKLPMHMDIKWNPRMTKTAGFCYYRIDRTKPSGRGARIELSSKVIDAPERIRDTLIHEMCHAAAWIISGYKDGHGPLWKSWAAKAGHVFPELPAITTCHSYQISCKFTYRCTECGYSIGRHSKSLDTERKVCGYCHGKFELIVNSQGGGATVGNPNTPGSHSYPKTPRTPNAFALYVKKNYKSVKSSRKSLKHGDVMKLLSAEFGKLKTNCS